MAQDHASSKKEELLVQLAERLVSMGWYIKDSPNLAGLINFFAQAPEDQIRGLITACEKYIANSPPCRRLSQHK